MSREFRIRPDGDRLHIWVQQRRGRRREGYEYRIGWIRPGDLRKLADKLHDYADATEHSA